MGKIFIENNYMVAIPKNLIDMESVYEQKNTQGINGRNDRARAAK